MIFENRAETGKKLTTKLSEWQGEKNLIVLAIPRGGVIVGKQLSEFLSCPLDIIVTKKLGAPGNPELAIGAIGPGGEEAIDEELAERVGADDNYIKDQKEKIKAEIARRVKEYRGERPALNLENKMVILTDDGVATGATMMAAIEVARQHNPKKIIVAVPVVSKDALEKIEKLADEVVYLEAPELFFAVGQFYREFEQIGDKEVVEILKNK